MSLRILFLGTSGSVPTNTRSLPAVLIKRQDEYLMFDCGEGVQRQMIKAKVGFHKKMKIFISHMHGDHVLGLLGILQTMALMDRERKVEVYGPVGLKRLLESAREVLQFCLTFPVEVYEIRDAGVICETKEYMVEAAKSSHVITSWAYAFVEKPRPGRFYPEKARALGVPEGELWSRLQHGESVTLPNGLIVNPHEVAGPPRKGRKIIYTGDTRPFGGFAEFAANADLIIHESTFDDTLSDKADLDGHSTPRQAAQQAAAAKAKKLVLTHISARYADPSVLLEQARKIFSDVLVAEDFMELELPLSEC
ncbi:MAG: ribonuclease Z [Candidatus Bathyarchaeota archaeon]|nr:ribonuclease Z [Candidatus Bathyarchaeota archaeon]